MLSVPLRCARAPQAPTLLRSFGLNSPSRFSSLCSTSAFFTTLRTRANATLKPTSTRCLHTTLHTRFSFHSSPILQRPTNSNFNAKPEAQAAREEKDLPEEETSRPPRVGRQILFVVVFSLALYGGASFHTHIITEKIAQKMGGLYFNMTNANMYKTLHKEIKITFDKKCDAFVKQLHLQSQSAKENIALLYHSLFQTDSSPAHRVLWIITLANAVVWGLWRIPALRGAMRRHFTHNPMTGKSYTLLTSMFSHDSFMHILFNMLAFQGFGLAAYHYLFLAQSRYQPAIHEATASYHYLAFFVTAGLFASLFSHAASAKLIYPLFLRSARKHVPDISISAVKSTFRPSLGASGAIYSSVVLTALAFPNNNISILFLPLAIPIQYGVGGMVLLDVLGIVRGWKFFDHYAHLGGAMFGALYYFYGPECWNNWRKSAKEAIGSDVSDYTVSYSI